MNGKINNKKQRGRFMNDNEYEQYRNYIDIKKEMGQFCNECGTVVDGDEIIDEICLACEGK